MNDEAALAEIRRAARAVQDAWPEARAAVLLLGGDKSTQRQDTEKARDLARELVMKGENRCPGLANAPCL